MKVLVLALIVTASLGGCTGPRGSYWAPSAAFTPEAECA
jgi:hypothetical protein